MASVELGALLSRAPIRALSRKYVVAHMSNANLGRPCTNEQSAESVSLSGP